MKKTVIFITLAVVALFGIGQWILTAKHAEEQPASAPTPAPVSEPAAALQTQPASELPSDTGYQVGDRLQSQTETVNPASEEFPQIEWEALSPADWDPMAAFKDLNMDTLDDADPRAMDALQKLRDTLDNAPIKPDLNGKRIRIPGFIVPLETRQGKIAEFLLVPYFGGCIHTPPPPANQIIHVVAEKPTDMKMMDAVWVSGTLETTRSETVMGYAGYRMKAVAIDAYVEPQKEEEEIVDLGR